MNRVISRRTALKGLGTAIALPWLEGMTSALQAAPLTSQSAKPLRTVFMYVPNGVHMQDWTPTATGSSWGTPFILEPLKAFQSDINVLSGLALDKAKANGDGPGDHARARRRF